MKTAKQSRAERLRHGPKLDGSTRFRMTKQMQEELAELGIKVGQVCRDALAKAIKQVKGEM